MVKTKNPDLEQQRKRQIMATAWRLLAEGSHRTMTLAHIASEAGVSKGMLTYYFDSKDQLITATIAQYLELQEQQLMMIIEDDSLSPMERLERLIDITLPDREVAEMQLRFLLEVWSFAKSSPEAMGMVREAYLRFRQHCEAMIELGADKGFVTATDKAWINVVLHALLDGMSFQLVIDQDLDAADLRRRVLALMTDLLAPK